MEEEIFSAFPDFKFYSNRAIYIGTILGGPLVAGYFAAENFKRLGQPDMAKRSWLIAILATIVIIGATILIPGIGSLPPYIIPLVYTGIAQYLIQHFQGGAIKAHVEKGGQLYSAWRGLWIGLVGGIILVAAVFIVLFLVNGSFPSL